MGRERKIVDKTELPDAKKTEEGEKVFAIVDIYYRKDARVRGFYYSAIIGRERPAFTYENVPYTSETWVLGQQSKTYLLLETKRFSDKVLAGLTLTPEQITGVKAEAIASIH